MMSLMNVVCLCMISLKSVGVCDVTEEWCL